MSPTTESEAHDRATEIMGLSDGLCSSLGMTLSLAIFASLHGLLVGTISAATCAAVSMGNAQWQSTPANEPKWRRAFLMAGMTLVAWLPAVPFYIGRAWPEYSICLTLVAILGVIIARLRHEPEPQSYIATFTGLLIATTAGIAAGGLVS